jgi:hypothetical protein
MAEGIHPWKLKLEVPVAVVLEPIETP